MKKRLICTALVFAFMLSLMPCAFAASGFNNFRRTNTYPEGKFTDVPSGCWFEENVKSAYEMGLAKGTGDTAFSPSKPITLAETITFAARIHKIYNTGRSDFAVSDPWYNTYVDYAVTNGIVSEYARSINLDKPAVRGDFAAVLACSVPEEALPALNEINNIPDVSAFDEREGYIRVLYAAGVLTGSDEYGSFRPDDTISRSEAVAIVTRVADPSLRKTFTLKEKPFEPVDMYKLANFYSLKKSMSDAEFRQAYNAALEFLAPLANLHPVDQMYCLTWGLREMFENSGEYSTSTPHYNDPYGYFILGIASCAGCARATGLCLNILGLNYEHVNENQWSHQWARVEFEGEYFICDPFGLYFGYEPAPYEHPYF